MPEPALSPRRDLTTRLRLDYVKLGVSDYAASKAFFRKALEPLGVAVVSDGAPSHGSSERWPQGTRPKDLACALDPRAQFIARAAPSNSRSGT